MTTVSPAREAIASARRIVVKIGSAALTSLDGGLDIARLDRLADAIEARMRAGSDVTVVSSGAIAAGLAPLGLTSWPHDLATKQAAASVGQLTLAHAWGTSFSRYGRVVGQLLLSANDFRRREHHRNAQRTLDRLRALHAVAVVNENDTVATAEIRFGDNDRLAALVAHLVGAQALVLLSDVAGLYDADPRQGSANLVPEVPAGADPAVALGPGGALGTGGMKSKLSAARLATDSGVPVLLASASDAAEALSQASVGTAFAARPIRLSARRFWLRHAADSRGAVLLDAGAVKAVIISRRSLLAAGVVGVQGQFSGGDVVDLLAPDGHVVARGVVEYDSAELDTMLGRSSSDLPEALRRPVVHADDLVKV